MRRRNTVPAVWFVASLIGCLAGYPPRAIAGPSPDTILPTNTVVCLSSPNVSAFQAKWTATQFGRFFRDPATARFATRLQARIRDRLDRGPLGLPFQDITAIAASETTYAISRDAGGKSVEWLVLDVSGREKEVAAAIRKAAARVAAMQGQAWQIPVLSARGNAITVTEYEYLPPSPSRFEFVRQRLAHFQRDDLLVFCTNEDAALEAAWRWDSQPAAALTGSPTYGAVISRLQGDITKDPARGRPDLWFFVRPMAYAETLRADSPLELPPGEVDLLEVFRHQQFHKISGVGASLHLASGEHDAVVRAAAFAPEVHLATNALRMLTFGDTPARAAQSWLPSGVSAYSDLNWNTAAAFDGFGSFFDEYMEERGAWQDLIDSVRADPNGPRIDLQKHLAALAGNRISIVSRAIVPLSVSSPQRLFIIETSNDGLLAMNVEASLRYDPLVRSRSFAGKTLFECFAAPPTPTWPAKHDATPNLESSPWAVIAVAHGALLISTHVELMELVLEKKRADDGAGTRYAKVIAKLERTWPGESCARGWFDLRQTLAPMFDLLRAGKLAHDHSLLGELLRLATNDDQPAAAFHGASPPAFSEVAHYFGEGGFTVQVEPGFGWFGRAVVLRPATPGIAKPAPISLCLATCNGERGVERSARDCERRGPVATVVAGGRRALSCVLRNRVGSALAWRRRACAAEQRLRGCVRVFGR